VEGAVTESGVFGGADAVFDAGVATVPQFQIGQLPATGVGEHTCPNRRQWYTPGPVSAEW
jgi:hypothetical protein